MFKCECGKEFEKANSFNGHKSHCKIHLEAVGKLDAYNVREIIYRQQLVKNQKFIATSKKEAINKKLQL